MLLGYADRRANWLVEAMALERLGRLAASRVFIQKHFVFGIPFVIRSDNGVVVNPKIHDIARTATVNPSRDEQHLTDTALGERGLRGARVLKLLAAANRDRHLTRGYGIGDEGDDGSVLL
jgi:hypothetical protein